MHLAWHHGPGVGGGSKRKARVGAKRPAHGKHRPAGSDGKFWRNQRAGCWQSGPYAVLMMVFVSYHGTPSFFRQKCAKSMPLQGAIQSEFFTRKPRRNELFRSATAKPLIVNCRPPDYDRSPWWFDFPSSIFETRKVQSCYVARRK